MAGSYNGSTSDFDSDRGCSTQPPAAKLNKGANIWPPL